MESEVVDRLQKFQLVSEETDGIQLETADVNVSKEECNNSLIGKIFGDKGANFTGLQNTLRTIWRTSKPFKVCEIGINQYQFIFE